MGFFLSTLAVAISQCAAGPELLAHMISNLKLLSPPKTYASD
jgi:hypothetical protein